LVVDDSAIDRHVVSSLLQKHGSSAVLTASNGVEALQVVERERPDVVLTDLMMPEMDGLELLQQLRSNYPAVPVILMTAHGSEDIAIRALKAGAASYVPKKSLARDLAETLDQVLAASKARRDDDLARDTSISSEARREV
jgi:CheY-like chemotaxis protein